MSDKEEEEDDQVELSDREEEEEEEDGNESEEEGNEALEDNEKEEEEEETGLDIDVNNPEDSAAVVALQRAARGRLARKRVQKIKELKELENNLVDIDLEMEQSSMKLQKSIRGRLARQKVNQIRQNNTTNDAVGNAATPADASEASNVRVRARADDVYRRLLNRQQIRRNRVENAIISSDLTEEPVLQEHVDPLKRTNTHGEVLGTAAEISHDEGDSLTHSLTHSLIYSLTHSSIKSY